MAEENCKFGNVNFTGALNVAGIFVCISQCEVTSGVKHRVATDRAITPFAGAFSNIDRP